MHTKNKTTKASGKPELPKYMIITEYGKDWQSKALVFDDPREAAKAWLKYDMGIRLLIDGEIHHGTYEQMRPIHNAIATLEGDAA